MKNFLSFDNLDIKSSLSLKSFITASSEINDCPITNVLQDNKNIWLSEEFLPQEIILNFRNIKLNEYPKKLTAIGVYCMNKYPNNPKIIEVLISEEEGNNFISLGHYDLSFKAGRQLIYLDDDNDIELEEVLSSVNFENLIIKLIIKETFGGKQTYINNLFLYDNIDTNNINPNSNMNSNNNLNMINDNNINNEYINNDENSQINDAINDINEIYMNEMNDMNKKEGNDKHKADNMDNMDNLGINENENHEIINQNEMKQFEEDISSKIEDFNISDYKSKTIYDYHKIKTKSKRSREVKTPKIFKKSSNQEDRINNRNINTTVRNYNNRNLLDYSNNNNSLITNTQFNNLNVNPSEKFNRLMNEFKNYKENQELIMNNYDTRIKLLEEKCLELKNTMKKMNATMNTIIESQYSQSQTSNDYFLKECQNMINEAIVNVISNMGRYMDPYPMPMYPNYPYNMRKNRNMMNNNMYLNYNNIHNGRNNNKYMYGQYSKKDMNYNQINNNNFYDDMNDNFYENENDGLNNMNDNNDNGEEYMGQEIKNGLENNYNNNNNDSNENNDNNDNNDNIVNSDNIENNADNDNNDNNMDFYENDAMNNNANIIENNNNINVNNANNNNINDRTNDAQTVKSLHSNDLYNDGLIPYDERIKSNSKKVPNSFARSTNNYRINTNNIINQNNINNQYNMNMNSIYESKTLKTKNKSNNIYDYANKYSTEVKNPKNNLNIKIDNNEDNMKKYLSKHSSKANIHKDEIIEIIEKNKKNNITTDEGLNKELSSDNSIDNIQINTKLTESILKSTLEKFENYISINNINNFGKSQNVYSANSFNNKKEIFGDGVDNSKLNKGKTPKKDD